jgi:hypothetical protein
MCSKQRLSDGMRVMTGNELEEYSHHHTSSYWSDRESIPITRPPIGQTGR